MARDGSGGYSLPTGTYTPNTLADADDITADFADITTAMAASIAKDGQTTPTANLPMGTYKHTGVGAGTARTEYADVGSVQDGDYLWCGTAGGTADAITLSPSPAVTTLVTGMKFRWKASANANTGAATAAISGLSAIAMEINDSALSAGDHAANKYYEGLYDGTALQISKFSAAATTGDFSGPASSTDNAVVRFDGTGGKTGQNSGVTIDDNDIITTPAGGGHAFTEGTAPSTAANTGAVYTKDSGGQPELFFREESDGDEVQLTKSGVVAATLLSNGGYASNRYYGGSFDNITNANTLVVTANRLYCRMFLCLEETTFTRIGIEVTSGAGTNGRLGIFQFDGSSPGSSARVVDAGTITTSTTGEKEATISQTLTPGMYFLAAVFDNTPTVRACVNNNASNWGQAFLGNAAQGTATDDAGGVYATHTFGALPATVGAGGGLTYVSSAAAVTPSIWLRVV